MPGSRYARAEVDLARVGGYFPDEESRFLFYALFNPEEIEILNAEHARYGGPDFEPDDRRNLSMESVSTMC